MNKTVLILTAALILAGCSSTGVKINPDRLDKYQPGVTSEADVAAELGKPTSVAKANGTTIWIYTYIGSQVRPESFIPIVGAIAGGADVEYSTVTLEFNSGTQKLIRTTSNAGGQGSGWNAEGIGQDRKPVREVQ